MAELMFTSETGMFHSACQVTIGKDVQWYGFQPMKHRRPVSEGKVDFSDRSGYINHTVTFELPDNVVKSAVSRTVDEYSTKTYVLTVCDCVSFTSEVARKCGLRVTRVNMTPYGFLQYLALWNSYKSKT